MGENSSVFKGAKRPVETVSWNNCVTFINKINGKLSGLDLRLPTEAEWEYGCRAETNAPFSFGDNITTEQVNYDGNFPYIRSKKGEYRKESVEVGSLPCNQWGLYKMHGNVYEWCSDWYGEYQAKTEVDPVGPEVGEDRVLRGVCWIYDGRNVRSAHRYRYGPGDRDDVYTGLRLARGHQKGEGLAEPKEK